MSNVDSNVVDARGKACLRENHLIVQVGRISIGWLFEATRLHPIEEKCHVGIAIWVREPMCQDTNDVDSGA